ncbi:hypothetical protein GCM10007989_10060 [Devosia pacifica]|uniref:Sulphotransferase Stf0 domain-containing protein n=1 Tax=Devosia pacifica TaxID=1335967 RepID=A0A918S1P8_9HYPH|nr:Stf0 family sulfotransferase [Devosia pacifica]GHA16865.1 hypothetical protein GCM10007989_10060 [Devosia pacifica]
MKKPVSYIICGTPRTGSTLLCELLAATNVCGCANSYFREQDVTWWAKRWGVLPGARLDDPRFDALYLAAMMRAATRGKVFGLRVMHASLDDAARRLGNALGSRERLVVQFERAFGPVSYIHLRRKDKVAQAISRLKAEQSGLWHLNADGSVMEGEERRAPVQYDAAQISTFVEELEKDEAGWDAFFSEQQIEPYRITYEDLTARPHDTIAEVLRLLGRDPSLAHDLPLPTAKMADATSREWAERFRQERPALA